MSCISLWFLRGNMKVLMFLFPVDANLLGEQIHVPSTFSTSQEIHNSAGIYPPEKKLSPQQKHFTK